MVSTRVGGVPEVLPPEMLVLAEPSAEGLLDALGEALDRLPHADAHEQHAAVSRMYSWPSVAQRTERVYLSVLDG